MREEKKERKKMGAGYNERVRDREEREKERKRIKERMNGCRRCVFLV